MQVEEFDTMQPIQRRNDPLGLLADHTVAVINSSGRQV
jgi:hypothetical protein